MSALDARRASRYRYPGRGGARAARRLAARRAGRVRAARGRLGLGQVDAAARRLPGSCRTSTAARSRAACVVGGLDTREHGPAELAAVAGTLFQDPETQVVMGTVRAELAFPLENRGWAPRRSRAGWRRPRSRSGIGGCSTARRTSSRAASCSASRSAPRSPGARALLLLDEPTSQLDPVAGDELLGVLRRLNEEWGTAVVLAEHRLERCLARRRPRASRCDDGAVASTAPPRAFLRLGADRRAGLQPPGARLFALAGLRPLRSASRTRARRRCARARLGPGRTPAEPRRGGRRRAASAGARRAGASRRRRGSS